MKLILFIAISFFLLNCSDTPSYNYENIEGKRTIKEDCNNLPFKNENGNITAVIEIPAGTNRKYEYNYEQKEFIQEIKNGEPRVVKFLPYIGNYGFIPGTYMDPSIDGDGDALDILIIGESIKQGTVVEVKPIATLMLLDGGREDHKVIGVPVDSKLNTTGISNYQSLGASIRNIIKIWFMNYKGPGEMEFQGWIGTDSTKQEIEKWIKK